MSGSAFRPSRTRLRLLTRLLALALALCALSTPASADPTRLVLWHSYRGGEEEALNEVIQRYRTLHPELTVEVIGIPNETLASKLTAAIPRNNGPDVFIFAHERVGGWAQSDNMLRPIEKGDIEEGAFFGETLGALRYRDALWGIPLNFKSLALFYNKRLVAEPPGSTDALLALRGTMPPGAFVLAYSAGQFFYNVEWLYGAGAVVLDEKGRMDWRQPAVVEGLRFFEKLVASGVIPKDNDAAAATRLFNDGKAAMVINGPWFLGEIKSNVDFGVAPLPVFSPTGKPSKPFLTVEALFIAKPTQHPAEALDLARFIAIDGAPLRATKGRQIVATTAAWQDPAIASDKILAAFRAQLPNTVPTDNRPEMALVWEPGDLAFKQLRGGASAEDASRAAARRYEAIAGAPPASPASPVPWLVLFSAALIGLLVVLVRGVMGIRRRKQGAAFRSGMAWVSPALVATFVLVIVPFGVGLVLAFFSHNAGQWTFVGGDNFVDILGAQRFEPLEPLSFYYALLVTVLWTAVNIVLHVGIGFALALLLNKKIGPLKAVYRVLLVLPWAVPSYITALLWKGLFATQSGAINGLLEALGLDGIDWFNHFGTAFFANVCANAWLGFPFMMVISLGALQAVPQDLLQAAEVDGASAWQRFRHITVPLVKPALVPAILLGIVWTFNQFNVIYLVSGGEPNNSTDILISEAYRWAFARQDQYGYAAAYAALIFLILLAWSRFSLRITRGLEEARA